MPVTATLAIRTIATDYSHMPIPPPAETPVLSAWRALLAQVRAGLHDMAAHPARSVVLLPYAQLLPLAARLWAEQFPDGFAPRFETTRTWAARLGYFSPGEQDLSFEHGRDWLTARALLEAAGRGTQRDLLAPLLLEQTAQLATVAASLPASMRPDWAERTCAVFSAAPSGALALEALVGQLAVSWAAFSDYATDVLFTPRAGQDLDALVIVPGLRDDPLTGTLAQHFYEKALLLPMPELPQQGQIHCHPCADGEDEAERAAACVLRHIQAGRVPVALASGDRLLQRRISALLGARGVALREETGWKLSTTHAGAALMAALQACTPRPSVDTVLDWLHLAPAFDTEALRQLETVLRQHQVRQWPQALGVAKAHTWVAPVQALREPMSGQHSLGDWLARLHTLLQGSGQWAALSQDRAGKAMLDALGLHEAGLNTWRHWPNAQRRMGLPEFSNWVRDTLEDASFHPEAPADAPVVVLPLTQLLGRPFAALVLPGADEQRLPATPEPSGAWSEAQRQDLLLNSREDLRREQAAAWQLALGVPVVDVLWRKSDDAGEPLLPSPLLQAWLLQHPAAANAPADPRNLRQLQAAPVSRPAPDAGTLPLPDLTASAYEALRTCPYRFFALHLLRLRAEEDLDTAVGKRDWGIWLHATLYRFHEQLRQSPDADRAALLDASAAHTHDTVAPYMEPGEFLPFAAAWPTLRQNYLTWLAAQEAQGLHYQQGECDSTRSIGPLRLRGRIDRIDASANGQRCLIDYKTEPLDRTKDRIKADTEETQLPFYALLAGDEEPRAAYLNLAERQAPTLHEFPDLQRVAALLYEGMVHDTQRIAQGAPLPPLGEGRACDWCDARGLCRKDWWTQAQ